MKILVLVPGDVGAHMSGPAIRAWLLAHGLSEYHDVSAAIDGRLPDDRPGNLRVFRATRPRFLAETLRHDVVMSACLPPYAVTAVRARGAVAVADHYDPVELELQTIQSDDRTRRRVQTLRRYQHRYADVVICAGEAQRRRLLDELRCVGRTGRSAPAIGIVPFGLPEAPTPSHDTPIRRHFPAIQTSDKIVLWWGKMWSWFDPETAMRAFVPLAHTRPDVKFVITAGRAPDANTDEYSLDWKARELASEYGLVGKTVFFVEEWIPYADRHHWLAEADLGLTLHANTAEAEVAARARYMDYLWAGLPCVLARGDEVADEFERAGFAVMVDPGDHEGVTRSLIRLLDDPEALARAQDAASALADRYRWPALARELNLVLERAASSLPTPRTRSIGALFGAGAYYTSRARESRRLRSA